MDNKNKNNNNKKRIIKDYDTLPEEILNGIKMQYPRGFAQHLVTYMNKDNKKVSALPFETEDIYYLVRMTVQEAKQIIEDDEDYDDDGVLRDDFSVEVPEIDNTTSFADDDEAYFRNEASTIEYADPDAEREYKDSLFQDSEYADKDLDDINLDGDDDDDDDDDEEDSKTDDFDDDDDDDDDLDLSNMEAFDEDDLDVFDAKKSSKGGKNKK